MSGEGFLNLVPGTENEASKISKSIKLQKG
jgi:hypothetical protein